MGNLVDQAQAAVVNVEVIDRSGLSPPALAPWDRGSPDDASIRPGTGSGFVIDPSGLVLTNHHLVENALLIYVTFPDGSREEAHAAGADPATDVALLRITPSSDPGTPRTFFALKLSDSDRLTVGDWVVALGNPSGEYVTASAGIVSAKSRSLQRATVSGDFLQTDVAIHPGNSGGPLLDLKGEVVGMSTALLGSGGTGIGFAVSGHALLTLLPQLEKHGHVARGWLGAYVKELTPLLARKLQAPVRSGAVVTYRLADSPAARGGLQQDDVISRIDARPVQSASALVHALLTRAPGSVLDLTVFRGRKRKDLRIRLGELPEWEPLEGAAQEEAVLDPLDALGFSLRTLDGRGTSKGARIEFVRSGSPAAQAGLREGGIIREADGLPIRSAGEFQGLLQRSKRGTRVLLRLDLPELPFARLRAVRVP